jgi:FkbM family methyltransferase
MQNIINNIYLKIYKIINIFLSFNFKIYYGLFRYGISPSYEHKKILDNISSINTFFDIGANKGQFTLLANYFFPKSKIYVFEPLSSQFKILQKIFSQKNNIKLFNFAVGKKNKSVNIFETKQKDSSSLLKPNKLQLKYFPEVYIQNTFKVRMIKLSSFIKNFKKPVFLKIDVQGYELEVLKGTTLKNIKYIYLEGSYVKLYSNQPLINSISKYLTSKNFKKVGRFNVLRDNFGKQLQADFLFINTKK